MINNKKLKFPSIIFCLLFLFSSIVYANEKDSAFSIMGRVDTSIKVLTLRFSVSIHETKTYSIPVTNGVFKFETNDLTAPRFADFFGNGFYSYILPIAPGYHLKLNGENYPNKEIQVSGNGEKFAKYYIKLDHLISSKNQLKINNKLSEIEFIKILDIRKSLQDSINKEIFSSIVSPTESDKWFANKIVLENLYDRANFLTEYILDNIKTFPNQSGKYFFENHIMFNYSEDKFLSKENLFSPSFNRLISDGRGYLGYATQMKFNEANGKVDPDFSFSIIFDIYKDPLIQDIALGRQMSIRLAMSNNYNVFKKNLPYFEKYIARFTDDIFRKLFNEEIERIKMIYAKLNVGMPAPIFSLKDQNGKAHNLNDFLGKVVYVDFWASWCAPCRAETTDFIRLYEKFRNNKEIVFLSIAVNDIDLDWRKALKEDKPTWLQLFDDGFIKMNYPVQIIPKFIIIDKNGKIANLDAPRPASKIIIEEMLLSATKK